MYADLHEVVWWLGQSRERKEADTFGLSSSASCSRDVQKRLQLWMENAAGDSQVISESVRDAAPCRLCEG